MIARPVRKFYSKDYRPVSRCCVTSVFAMPGDVCVVCGNSRAKDRSVSMHRFPRGPTRRKQWLKALKVDEKDVKDHHRVCSRHFANADASNTPDLTLGKRFASPTGSEAALVDGLLFASISSRATLRRQNFRTGQAITALLSPRCFPRNVLFFHIRFISINGTTCQRAEFKLTTLCIDSNGEVLRE